MDKQNSSKRSWKQMSRNVVAKMVKVFGFGKMPLCIFSMLLSAWIYSLIFGIWLAVGFVVMLFIHEMGHVLAAKKKGHKAFAPVFIPMLGAFILTSGFKDQEEEAYVGFAGPFIGGLAGLAVFIIWAVLPHDYTVLLVTSFIATYLNLFNLLPISPLDGGRVTQIVGSWFKWVGLVMLLGMTLLVRQPAMLLIWIIVLTDFDIKFKLKFVLGSAGFVAILFWTYWGYFFQKWYLDLSNILAGVLILVLIFLGKEEDKARARWRKAQKQTVVARRVRIKWFFLYAGLLVGLVALMAVQILTIYSYRR